ncbi:MAG: hypothetical protein AAFX93_00780 [Verrucomicrobiota bacterium]
MATNIFAHFYTKTATSCSSLLLVGSVLISPSTTNAISFLSTYTLSGDSSGDDFGTAVSGVADLDGDNIPDLLIGAPGVVVGSGRRAQNFGMVRVISGSDGSVIRSIIGDNVNGNLGTSVSGLGDINNDGRADFVAGAPGSSNELGSAHVYSGLDGSTLHDFDGSSPDRNFGSAVSGIGDVDGDQRPDIVVGTRLDSVFTNVGRVSVYSGANGSELLGLSGGQFDGQFGTSVAGIADINNDGRADLVVGEPGSNNLRGTVRAISGSDGGQIFQVDNVDLDDDFGFSISEAGDVNNDGVVDFVVGAPEIFSGSGYIAVISGAGFEGGTANPEILNVSGATQNEAFGHSVSGLGDVNEDGYDDLLIGAPTASDNGTFSGKTIVISGLDGSTLFSFVGDGANDQFGSSVSAAGDLNGDGITDFIVGAPNGGENDGGYARVYLSQVPEPSQFASIAGVLVLSMVWWLKRRPIG